MGLIRFEWAKDDRSEKILFEGSIGKEKDIDLLSFYGWDRDPFEKFEKLPENLFVGRKSEKNELLHYIESGSKFGIVKGCGGSGKTTLLQWLNDHLKSSGEMVCYVSAKKSMYEDFYQELFKELKLNFSFFDKKEFTPEKLYKLFKRKLKDKKFYIIIDDYEDLSKKNQRIIQKLFKAFDKMHLVVSFNFDIAKKVDITPYGNIAFNVDVSQMHEVDFISIIESRMNYAGVSEVTPLTKVMIKNIAKKVDHVVLDFLILSQRNVNKVYSTGSSYKVVSITTQEKELDEAEKKEKTQYEGDLIINDLLAGEAEFEDIDK